MAEVRVLVEDHFLAQLKERFGQVTNAEIIREALALLDWASAERAKHRVILSSEPNGKDLARLVMPMLDRAANRRPAASTS